jgi:adenine-specific DNA methylase/DNA-binding XRE family transcriptional regulator
MDAIAIKQLREALGETQEQFARRFEVTQISVAYWENGRSRPNMDRIQALQELTKNPDSQRRKSLEPPFRPIQYLGSKLKLANTIASIVDELTTPGAHAADLFSGSGVVSNILARNRSVTAVDVQAYAEILGKGLLTTAPEEFTVLTSSNFMASFHETYEILRKYASTALEIEEQALQQAERGNPASLERLIEGGSIAVWSQRPEQANDKELSQILSLLDVRLKKAGFVDRDVVATRYFAGPYFSYAQALALDAVYIASKKLGVTTEAAAMAVLLSTASEIVNTVGKQFAQPIKLKKADGTYTKILVNRSIRDRRLETIGVFEWWANKWAAAASLQQSRNEVRCQDVMEFINEDKRSGIYYADPPYTIDHYSRFYHVLETLVCRDSPVLDEMKKRGQLAVMRGIYRRGRFQSEFCIPSKAEHAFERLISAVAEKKVPFLLSYSPFEHNSTDRPRLLPVERIASIASAYFAKVDVVEVEEHSHRKLNARAVNAPTKSGAEKLFVCSW